MAPAASTMTRKFAAQQQEHHGDPDRDQTGVDDERTGIPGQRLHDDERREQRDREQGGDARRAGPAEEALGTR